MERFIDIAKEQGRIGVVLTCKDRLIHYYEKFGLVNEGLAAKSTHGGAEWYQMRLSLLDTNVKNLDLCKIFQNKILVLCRFRLDFFLDLCYTN